MSKITPKGRLLIIDPNQDENGRGLVPYDLEDLCIGLSLRVYCPNRASANDPNKSNVINFIIGTKDDNGERYLTTNYTDISGIAPLSNTVEGLGIENIDINYSSWYHPQITVKFVDVRGASLFAPEETQTNSSFFTALFHFPSPTFELEIKGFLGGTATYDLKVSEFKGELNADTGNFEATVSFIGSMYGPYTDMPLTYLAVAPWMRGEYDGYSYWESSDFRDHEGNAVPKFSAFSATVEKAKGNNSDVADANGSLTVAGENEGIFNATNQIILLTSIQHNLLEMAIYLAKDKDGGGNAAMSKDTGLIYFYSSLPWDGIREKITNENSDFNISFRSLNDKLKEAGISSSGISVTILYNTLKGIFDVYKPLKEVYQYWADEYDLDVLKDAKSVFFGLGNNIALLPKSLCNNNNKACQCYWHFFDEIAQNCKTQIEVCEDRIKQLQDSISKKRELIIAENLGFNQSIGNIFNIGFAHFDTFTYLFNECINKINSQLSSELRGPAKFGWSPENLDVQELYNGGMPPFPIFYKMEAREDGTQNKVIVWPGSDGIPNGQTLEEVKFVEAMYEAVGNYRNEYDYLSVPLTKNKLPIPGMPSDVAQLPLLYSDLVYIQDKINPYDYLQSSNILKDSFTNYKEVKDNLYATLFLRLQMLLVQYYNCEYTTWSNNKINKSDKNKIEISDGDFIGKIEAYNVFNVVKNLPSDFINKLVIDPYFLSFSDFLSFVLNTENIEQIYSKVGGNIFGNIDGNGSLADATQDGWKSVWLHDYLWTWPEQIQNAIREKDSCKIVRKDEVKSSKVAECFNYFDRTQLDSLFTNASATIDESKAKYFKLFPILSTEGDDKNMELLADAVIPNGRVDDTGKGLSPFATTRSNIAFGTRRWIFGCSYYYRCNDKSFEVGFDNDMLKAFIYLHSLDLERKDKEGNITVPDSYGQILRLGSEIWWESLDDESRNTLKNIIIDSDRGNYSVYEQIKKTFVKFDDIVKKETSGETKTKFANEAKEEFAHKMFLNWILDDFKTIREWFEIKKFNEEGGGVWETLDESGFTEYIKSCQINKRTPNIKLNWDAYAKHAEYVGTEKDKYCIIDLKCEYPSKDSILPEKISKIFNYLPVVHATAFLEKPYIVTISSEWYSRIFNAFKSQLAALAGEVQADNTDTAEGYSSVPPSMNSNDDVKLAIYLGLKNLYEKSFSGKDLSRWRLKRNDNFFKSFKFLDSFMRDIGYVWSADVEAAADYIANSMGSTISTETITSSNFYSFLGSICEGANGVMLAFPTYSDYFSSKETPATNLANSLFEPRMYVEGKESSSTYICLYPGKPSQHLDYSPMPNSDGVFNNYRDDGFNLDDDIPQFSVEGQGESNGLMPCFVVDYAKQNQGIFKRISVGMQDAKNTDAAIKYTYDLGSKAHQAANEVSLTNQNLYSIYSSYSYSCTVEMLGDVEIMPLMYFQLRHCPMFNGAYQIIEVKHNVKPGDITTTFTGVRQSLSSVPFVDFSQVVSNIDFERNNEYQIMEDESSFISNVENYPSDNVNNSSLGKVYQGEVNAYRGNDADGENWADWENSLSYLPSGSTITDFCFGQSIYNRMRFYYNQKYTWSDGKGKFIPNHLHGKCARAVREYITCGSHIRINGANGWQFHNVLDNCGFQCITDIGGTFGDGIYYAPDGTLLDLKTIKGRDTFTQKWAKNGDICVLMPKTKSIYGHAEMFINDDTFGGRRWAADGLSPNMSCYGTDPIVKIAVYRHPSLIA